MTRLNSFWKQFTLCCGVVIVSAVQPAPLWAARELTFVFRTTIDATPAGGAPNTPLTVTYTFDPDLRSQYGSANPLLSGYYGPIHMVVQLGNESVKATQQTAIEVENLDGDSDYY